MTHVQQPRHPRGVKLRATLCLVLTACGASKPEPQLGGPEHSCQEPTGPIPLPLPELRSKLGLRVELAEKEIERQLARNVPRTLARAKNQSIGAPGKVTYRVDRDGFSISANDTGLEVNTRLLGDIDVCKPVGPFCVAYGACNPQWAVQVAVPTDFDQDLSLRVRTAVNITKGCVLRPVGYDATSELERITRQQTRNVRQRIRSEVQRVERQMQEAWRRIHEPLALEGGGCLRLAVDEVAFRPISQREGRLSTAVQAEGTLALSCDDDAPEEASAPVGASRQSDDGPVVTAKPELQPSVDMAVGVDWPLAELEQALEHATGHKSALRVVGGAEGAPNELHLNRDVSAACPHWERVAPRLDERGLRLEPVSGSGESPPVLSPPATFAQLEPALDQLESRLSQAITQAGEQGVTVDVDKQLEFDVEVGADRLRLIRRARGEANVHTTRSTPATTN